jgi:hypothetical protein
LEPGPELSFEQVVYRGLGRAFARVRAGLRADERVALLDAATSSRCFDPQVSGTRAPWLLALADEAGVTEEASVRIFANPPGTGRGAVRACIKATVRP